MPGNSGIFNDAKWITNHGREDNSWDPIDYGPAPLFRKEFFSADKPVSALLRICGLGLFTAKLNDRAVTDEVLTPAVSRYDRTVYYNDYDVTKLLVSGQNCLGVVLGNGWYNYPAGYTWDFEKASWRHHPKLIACLFIKYEDGKETIIKSDSSWLSGKGPIIYNFTRDGEDYDARLFEEGWNLAGFDASSWEKTFICRPPGGIYKKAFHPPVKIIKTHQAIFISEKFSRLHRYFRQYSGNVYDFGVNMSGWIKITVSGDAGSEVEIRYSERYTAGGGIDTADTNRFLNSGRGHCCRYILSGKGIETWHPVFTYYGFRYAEIISSGNVEIIKAEALEVHTDLKTAGSFECGNEMINRIHAASVQATLSNYHGIPTDCPHREQNGWTGDASLSSEQALMNFDMTEAYRKWLYDFKDVQRPNGQLPGIVPTSSWGYNTGSGPAWDSALIMIPLAVYELKGDISLAKEMLENMELYMDYLHLMADEYLLEFGIGDHLPPEKNKPIPLMFTDTAYYFACASAMAKLEKIIGTGKENFYNDLALKVREAFRKKFIKDGEVIFKESQTALACAVYMKLLDENEIPKTAKQLSELVKKNGNHIDCGILGTKYIFSALSENGYAETALDFVLNPEYPGYAFWINSGMTTLCEDWEMKCSLNHHMFSEVDHWFYRHLAGIRPLKPGFEAVEIIPRFDSRLGWVKASHNGIEVYWDNEKLTVKSPVPVKVFVGGIFHEAGPGSHEWKR